MARLLKPPKVGEYRDRGEGAVIDLFYDRNEHTHYAEYRGHRVAHESIAQVRTLLAAKIKELRDVTWFGVIIVRTPSDNDHGRSVGLVTGIKYERKWVARLADGNLREIGWWHDPKHDELRAIDNRIGGLVNVALGGPSTLAAIGQQHLRLGASDGLLLGPGPRGSEGEGG